MNRLSFVCRALAHSLGVVLLLLGIACAGLDPSNSNPQAGLTATNTPPAGDLQINETIHKGDKLTIEFFEAVGMPPTYQTLVREDGTINLPMNKVVVADGKNKRELEEEIVKLYVPSLYKRMTVNLKPEERYYYVDGEVKTPGIKPHPGNLTATKAISAAGDFTDFARKTNIEIIRANGQKVHMNWKKAMKDPTKYDVPVYPGDRIHVHRRLI